MKRSYKINSIFAIASVMLLTSSAWGQASAVSQILEEVVGFSDGDAIRVNREDPSLPPLSQLDVVGADFRACELTSAGYVCLKGNDVYVWGKPTPLTPPDAATDEGSLLFSCTDDNLPFDKKKEVACTSATVNAAGDEYVVGGKGKGKLFDVTLVKSCSGLPGGEPLSDHPDLCFDSLATGRPLIVTLEYTKDDSSLGAGILALEERTRASLIGIDGNVTDFGGSKAWGLKGKERLTGLTALQLSEESFPAIAANDFLLATSTADRIIALTTADPGSPQNFSVFDIAAARAGNPKAECVFDGPQSPISSGFKSGLVYVADGQYCSLYVLEPAEDPNNPFKLQQIAVIDTQIGSQEFALEGVTTAPGITIDLAACAQQGTCDFIPDTGTNGKPDVEVLSLNVNSGTPTSATVYQIKNAPDCRYIPGVCVQLEKYVDAYTSFLGGSQDTNENAIRFLISEGVVRPEPGNNCTPATASVPDICKLGPAPDFEPNPGGWQLNVNGLMPKEITDAATIPDPFIISREWRGQKINGFIWEALFIDAEDVVTEDTYEMIFDTEDLVTSGNGAVWGCNDSPENLTEALQEDLATTVSENFYSGSGPDEHRDTLTNAPGCGSNRSAGWRFSLRPYDLEKTPCSVAYPEDVLWDSDGVCGVGGENETVDDAVLMKSLISLWGDLGDVLENFACDARDGQTSGQPLLESACNSSLIPAFDNGTDKLSKCWTALQQPKQSAGDQNCTAWLSQTSNLRNNVVTATQNAPALDSTGNPDRANRKGEVLVRIDVLLNLYHTRVVPSIDTGFCEPDNPDYDLGCP